MSQEDDGIRLPTKISYAFLLAVTIQLVSTVWFVSSYVKEYELNSETAKSQYENIKIEIKQLESAVVPRSELIALEKEVADLKDRLLYMERNNARKK